jgi:hypothetical protein
MSRNRGKRCPRCGDIALVRTENISNCPDPFPSEGIMHAKVSCVEMPTTTHFPARVIRPIKEHARVANAIGTHGRIACKVFPVIGSEEAMDIVIVA